MPWKETCVVDERLRFIAACAEDEESMSALCRRFEISRTTGYKWLERYDELGPVGLCSRVPVARVHPHKMSEEVLAAVLAARKAHPFWGPKKLRWWLAEREPTRSWPAPSTIGEALKKHGLIRPRRRRPRVPPGASPLERGVVANDVWCTDFKGDFMMGDRTRCYPFTLLDEASRYLLRCEGLASTKLQAVRPHFEAAFREYGLPAAIRSDNGPPFASVAPGGLSTLSVWWIQSGIQPLRIDPGEPQQNGVHERMHRTLGQEAINPAADRMTDQQRAFDCFRREYNDERPHEALGMKPPSRVYSLSRRGYGELREPDYDIGYDVKDVDGRGRVSIRGLVMELPRCMARTRLGLRVRDDDAVDVFYGPVRLGHVVDVAKNGRRVTRRFVRA
jgi:putative transposase